MASQYGEHEFILWHFEDRPGRFLDIGAGDGITHSNTRCLLDAGWTGVFLEPAISQLRWLLENYSDDERVEILPYSLNGACRASVIYDARDFSTTLPQQVKLIDEHSQGAVKWRERPVYEIDWKALASLTKPESFSFINIDTEGTCRDLLEGMPSMFKPEMMCVEIDPPNENTKMELTVVAMRQGFKHYQVIGGNLLVWR